MLLNVLACLFASSAMLNVEAVEYVTDVAYEDLNCTGPTVYALPYFPADVCGEIISEYVSNMSMKATCDGLQGWFSSATCSGEPDMFEPFAECHLIKDDTMSADAICQDFPDLVRVTLQYGNCSSLNMDGYSTSTNLAVPTHVPVGDCFPDVVVSGPYSDVGTPMGQSFKVEKQGSDYKVTRFYSDDCTGTTAVFNNVADGVCEEIGSGDGETSTSLQAVLLEVVSSSTTVGRRLRNDPKPFTLTLEQIKKYFPNLKL
ncbi:hypothetical protein BASA81_007821 [Batrachochytrium salamandrivorans]|nr:hypothetical protein BASA81_007821 [Batrachochytrium salamandrivorans]